MSKYESNFLKGLGFVFLFIQPLIFFSCSPKNYTSSIDYNFKGNNSVVDYSSLDYWAAHPYKNDPSDKIPKDLDNTRDSIADVFFIHPTTYTNQKMEMGWNADINKKELNRKTDNSTILYQASVFNKYCRVFAPRYRQANLHAFYSGDSNSAKAALDLAYEDVRAAFVNYLKNYNKGRPIIIAAHSQGTLHAARLLKEFFEGKPLEKQLVCAYIIGLPIFTNYFSTLKPCNDSTSTGCLIGWRTFEEGYEAPFVKIEKQKAFVINPLTWNMDTSMAIATLNKGGVLRNFDKVIPGLVHAKIHGNVLWVNKPKFFGNILLKTKNYHIADYNFFYENIRENVGTRIRAFLKK